MHAVSATTPTSPCAAAAFSCDDRATRALSPADRAELLELARRVFGRDLEHYLRPRFARYRSVLRVRAGGRLAAFQLLDGFREEGAAHVYFGPLFSRGRAWLPAVVEWLERQLDASHRPLHLTTEAENPHVVLAFKTLFPASFPCFDDGGAAPAAVAALAARFASRLEHVRGLDCARLTTRSNASLYLAREGCREVLDWLRWRGVSLAAGQAQVLLATCGEDPLARRRFRVQLARGARLLASGATARGEALRPFLRSRGRG